MPSPEPARSATIEATEPTPRPSREYLAWVLDHRHLIQAELERWERVAREKQLAPAGEWRLWCLQTGRGWGKTRSAAEYVRSVLEAGCRDVLAIGPTATDVHDVMAPMLQRVIPGCEYRRSIEAPAIFWQGTTIHLRSGQRIDRCRGLEVGCVWADEIDHWRPEGMTPWEAWVSVVEPTCRVSPARFVLTSTPRRGGLLSRLVKRSDVALTRGHTSENAENLSPGFVESLSRAYGGSWLERQELGGEIVDDIEGALVSPAMIDLARVERPPDLVRIVVGVDPSGGREEQGIVVVGKGADGDAYVLADRTCLLSPEGWGRRVAEAVDRFEADRVVAERNFGGDMVASTLQTVAPRCGVRLVTASRGKAVRFEPVGALYEQGRVHHVGSFPQLEDEVCGFTADGWDGEGSPNRADALVWAVTDLLLGQHGLTPRDLYGEAGLALAP